MLRSMSGKGKDVSNKRDGHSKDGLIKKYIQPVTTPAVSLTNYTKYNQYFSANHW